MPKVENLPAIRIKEIRPVGSDGVDHRAMPLRVRASGVLSLEKPLVVSSVAGKNMTTKLDAESIVNRCERSIRTDCNVCA